MSTKKENGVFADLQQKTDEVLQLAHDTIRESERMLAITKYVVIVAITVLILLVAHIIR